MHRFIIILVLIFSFFCSVFATSKISNRELANDLTGILVSKNNIENFENTFPNTKNSTLHKNGSEIDRIVIFYKNGTFRTYSPE